MSVCGADSGSETCTSGFTAAMECTLGDRDLATERSFSSCVAGRTYALPLIRNWTLEVGNHHAASAAGLSAS